MRIAFIRKYLIVMIMTILISTCQKEQETLKSVDYKSSEITNSTEPDIIKTINIGTTIFSESRVIEGVVVNIKDIIEIYELGPSLILDKNKYIISDREECTVYLLDNGKLKKLVDFGNGPTDLKTISSVASNGSSVYINDSNSRKFVEFDTNGKFINSYITQNRYNKFSIQKSGINAVFTEYLKPSRTGICFHEGFLEISQERYPPISIMDIKVSIPPEEAQHSYFCMIASNDRYTVFTNPIINYLYVVDSVDYTEIQFNIIDPFYSKEYKGERSVNGVSPSFHLINNAVAIDEDGVIFLGKGGGFDYGRKHRIEIYTVRGNYIETIIVQNHPDFLDCKDNVLMVTDNSEKNNIMIYDYSKYKDSWLD
ncbi:MAG: hypothetical protein KAU17_07100 [Spirochaetales bacterium]|jgi:hypothetical protein|nr:hypothetical protein [Spirochaetales bacterium]